MIGAWLSLPLPGLVLALAGAYSAAAALLIWLSFSRLTAAWVQKLQGVAPELFGAIMIIFGILIGFLASDVWDRSRQAATVVETESAQLTTLNALALATDAPVAAIRQAIRRYASAVVEKEWPSMADRKTGAPEAEMALGALLRTAASAAQDGNGAFDRLLLDTALKIQGARAERLLIAADNSENVKWACVLILALAGQISLAIVHIERMRAQIAAMTIFTVSIVLIIALIAAHEGPFQPPIFVSPAPIANVLKLVPAPA